MSDCTASYYTNGIKLRSGQASCKKNRRTLTVICGSATPAAGEIHIDELPAGTPLHVKGVESPLVWAGRGAQARNDRHFDADALREQFGDQYPQIVAIAAGNLSLTGAKESRGYARSVADAYVRTLDPVGIAHRLTDTPGAMLAVTPETLLEQVGGNEAAFAEIAYLFSRQLASDNYVGHTQLLRLISGRHGCDDAFDGLINNLEAARTSAGKSKPEAYDALQKHLEKLAAIDEMYASAILDVTGRGAAIRTMPVDRRAFVGHLPESHRVDRRLADRLGARRSYHRTETFADGIVFEWCGIKDDGSVVVFESEHRDAGELSACRLDDWLRYTYPSVESALAGKDGTLHDPQPLTYDETTSEWLSRADWDAWNERHNASLLDGATELAGHLLVLIPTR